MTTAIRLLRGIGSDGRDYDFTETTSTSAAGTPEDPGARTQGMPSFTMMGGGRLNRLNESEFLMVPKGIIVRLKG
ncbi:MAG: hypothetical protein ABIT36_00255 [Steroidobacteraceae bacterium]